MANSVAGTFTATGQSATAVGSSFLITMDFASTGSVNIQTEMPGGSWITIETVTADFCKVWDGAAVTSLRLDCTDATGNIEYSVKNAH